MKKTLATLALAGSLALVGVAPALAVGYPASEPAAAVDDAAVAPGEQLIFSGGGMLANEPVDVTVTLIDSAAPAAGTQSVGAKINVFLAPETFSTTANAEGKFSLPLSFSDSGTYSITATGRISKTTVGPVTVQVDTTFAEAGAGASLPNANGGAALANTGADASLLLWGAAGVGVLGLGAAGVILARRNKATANA
ncbi:LPXTG cell wall anchor domain-containing protein [Pseudarthrobacter sp. SSS035]|uniref:LPXTG cell wall anchor domain-containing protein n=1 Tax=Pseudarthrobacter sp. SSS035 TaxID=2931399 RepID=UPI00200D7E46|nr:LPXTG cell wall anchor domain-containing protein [Pseudarthrobacter sp. SSS035]